VESPSVTTWVMTGTGNKIRYFSK